MRAFYLVYANDKDIVPEIETALRPYLMDIGTVESGTPEFLNIVHSWEKYAGWDWLKEMPRAGSARWAITGGFGEVPQTVCSGLITKINQQTGLEQTARYVAVTVGERENPLTPFNARTFWELR